MVSNEIKFEFDHELLARDELDVIFKNVDEFLNLRYDKDLNFYVKRNEGEIYEFRDLSGEDSDFVEYEKERFFKFRYDNGNCLFWQIFILPFLIIVPLTSFMMFSIKEMKSVSEKTWTCSLRTWIPTLTLRIMLKIRLIGMTVFLTLRILQDITT